MDPESHQSPQQLLQCPPSSPVPFMHGCTCRGWTHGFVCTHTHANTGSKVPAHGHTQVLQGRCVLCTKTQPYLSYVHLKMNLYMLHTLQQPCSLAHVCAGMHTAHTCLEGLFIPTPVCLKHVLRRIKMGGGQGRFFWRGGWGGRGPLSEGIVFLCCTHPSPGSPCCCSIFPQQAVGTSSGRSCSCGPCGLGNRSEDRPGGAEQISGMVGWSHSSTRMRDPREVAARGLGTMGTLRCGLLAKNLR